MTKPNDHLPGITAMVTHMNPPDPLKMSNYAVVPDAAPEGMTVEQAQWVWSRAGELFTENELIGILTESLQGGPELKPIYEQRVSTLESVPERNDAFGPIVFTVLRTLSARSSRVEVDDRGSCIVLNRSLWSYLTQHLLSLLVRSGQAPDSLEELMLLRDLGL